MKGSIQIVKLVWKILGKIVTPPVPYDFNHREIEDDENTLPEDVKEGYFAVHTVDGGVLKRFVIEISYLGHPKFLKLLEQAEEEFGFAQIGILAIPCTYSDLQSIVG
ncbi:hypothetical protein ABFS83_10G048200 [Erythranthe nasuta]